MASKHGLRTKKQEITSSRVSNSHSSSTTSPSKHFRETSVDGLSSPAASSAQSKPHYFSSESTPLDAERSKENVTVTVRFRPLSQREIRQGEDIAWYADGETTVRNEHNSSIAYAYDRVFGPTTTTRHVYDVAAQHVVNGAMEGINGTIFAYGVTSSGKTHTMHGDQRSPGIVPLAVKDAFSIIQETPSREFLLRVSYLEIYNEVVNDLLNPAGQNLRIREDAQGSFVEGIKEEVVLSPAHALSLIAAGEEHRHVGSTNFNLLSSRSHTIFTLIIESSPYGENSEGEAVNLAQLNLIDLAGSESSKAETTGLRRKEGSYINKSLLTLGTVISKITDRRASHVPYRDSKLTRLLQSSLSGHGRVSLVCTVTPASSSAEETHNTMKFAHRAKHIEIQTAQNKIIDEKSLIKKYQNEIHSLKEELDHLKKGIVTIPQLRDSGEDDIVLLKQKLEDGQVKLQSRLEQEEEAKEALLSRIQRLTKLILVSSKVSQSSRFPNRPGPRRRHSFGEEELAYLPHRRHNLILDEENMDLYVSLDGNADIADDLLREGKKTRKQKFLNWLKPRKRDSSLGALTSTSDKSSGSTPSTPQAGRSNIHSESRFSNSLLTESSPSVDVLSETRHDREVPDENFLGQDNTFLRQEDSLLEQEENFLGQVTPLTSIKRIDQNDLLREQKILSGEVALHSSSLKTLSEEAARNPHKKHIQGEMRKFSDEIEGKNEQISLLEKQVADSIMDNRELSLSVAELVAQLNDKSFELEVRVADNRIIHEQLNEKMNECERLQEAIIILKQQLTDALEFRNSNTVAVSKKDTNEDITKQTQVTEIEELKQKVAELTESNEQLESRNQKLADEGCYVKELASAAAVELKALSEEVAKLMNHNEILSAELTAVKSSPTQSKTSGVSGVMRKNSRRETHVKRQDQTGSASELKKELAISRQRENSYEAALVEKEHREAELQKKVEESKQREAYLENELANMSVVVAKLNKSQGFNTDDSIFTKKDLLDS